MSAAGHGESDPPKSVGEGKIQSCPASPAALRALGDSPKIFHMARGTGQNHTGKLRISKNGVKWS